MSDTLEPTTDVVETPAIEQEVAEATGTPEDLGALKRALEHEREERRQAKEELRRIREDEDARTELLKEWGYETVDDEPEEDPDLDFEDDPIAPVRTELEEIKQWKQEQQHTQLVTAFDKAVDKLEEGSDWELEQHDREWIWDRAHRAKSGLTTDSINEAHQALIDRYERIAESAVERAKKPKPQPSTVTAAGSAATEVPDLDSHQKRVEAMMERLRGGPNT